MGQKKVPAAVKEPHPGPDLPFVHGSFRELPGLVACHEISREGGNRQPGKEEETGDSLGGEYSPSQSCVGGTRYEVG